MVYADQWEHFVAAAGPGTEPGGFIERYHRLLTDPDPAVHGPAALAWTTWEAATSTLLRDQAHLAEVQDPGYATTFARIENHYFYHRGWLEEGALIDGARVLAENAIPGVIVQGRYDVVCPLGTAWALHRAWPEAELVITPDAGHAFSEPSTLDALVRATDRLADHLAPGSGAATRQEEDE